MSRSGILPSVEEVFKHSFDEATKLLAEFTGNAEVMNALNALAQRLEDVFNAGGKVLIAGNGGSMADAMHFAEEWTGRFRNERRPLPAMALSDPTHLTCVSNDYGFDYVFSRMVDGFGQKDDILILLSTSGNSNNLIVAAEAAKKRGMHVVGFLGKGGGKLAPLCDAVIMAPGKTSDRIQELHMMSLHILIEAVEVRLGLAKA